MNTRINIKRLEEKQKNSLHGQLENIRKKLHDNEPNLRKKIEQILNETQNKARDSNLDMSQPFALKVEELEEDVKRRYDGEVSNDFVNQSILAELLISRNIKGVEQHDFFKKIGYKKVEGYDNLEVLNHTELLMIDISGIKCFNDNYGHEACDKQIETIIGQIVPIIQQNGLNPLVNIISRSFSQYYVLIEGGRPEQMQKVKEQIEAIQSELKILCANTGLTRKDENTFFEINKHLKEEKRNKVEVAQGKLFALIPNSDETPKIEPIKRTFFHELIHRAIIKNNDQIQKTSLENKVGNFEKLENCILKDITLFFYHPYVRQFIEAKKISQEDLINLIMDSLHEVIGYKEQKNLNKFNDSSQRTESVRLPEKDNHK